MVEYKKHLTSFKNFIKVEKEFQEVLYPKFERNKKDKNEFYVTYISYSGIDRNRCSETYEYDENLKTFNKIHWSVGYAG